MGCRDQYCSCFSRISAIAELVHSQNLPVDVVVVGQVPERHLAARAVLIRSREARDPGIWGSPGKAGEGLRASVGVGIRATATTNTEVQQHQL